jgi:putative pyruvate formate lyase activating enzyme
MHKFEPAYILSYRQSLLQEKARQAQSLMSSCTLCPRQCRVDRTAGEIGYCRTADLAYVAGYDTHFGEESPLVGTGGSGTIFFTHCNLLCSFCQNYNISHRGAGEAVTDR